VPLVSWRWVSLTLEHMAEMTATVCAYDLGPLHAKTTVNMSRHCTWYSVVERRPSTSALELLLGGVERRLAASAGVDTGRRGVLVVLAAERGFGALFTENAELLCGNISASMSPHV